MPSGLERYYGKGPLDFLTFSCYHRLPLLKRRIPGAFCAGIEESSPDRLCGHARACASGDQRSGVGNTFNGAAQTETAGIAAYA